MVIYAKTSGVAGPFRRFASYVLGVARLYNPGNLIVQFHMKKCSEKLLSMVNVKNFLTFLESQIVASFFLFHMKNKLFVFPLMKLHHAGKFFSAFIWQKLFYFNGTKKEQDLTCSLEENHRRLARKMFKTEELLVHRHRGSDEYLERDFSI